MELRRALLQLLTTQSGLNYLVKIDGQGKLRWCRNNILIDTSAGHWKDAGSGRGIIPQEMPGPDSDAPPRGSNDSSPSISAASMTAEQENAAMHYIGEPKGKYRWTRALKRHLTPHGIMERLLRKTVRRNTWIYVSVSRRSAYKSGTVLRLPSRTKIVRVCIHLSAFPSFISSRFRQYIHWHQR